MTDELVGNHDRNSHAAFRNKGAGKENGSPSEWDKFYYCNYNCPYPRSNSMMAAITIAWGYFVQMMMILPAVMVMIGLFSVWVSDEMVIKYLGRTSGVKGIFLAILFGALPTGPLYVAFPMAAALLKKGASISSVIIFLSAWACIKLPQEMMELQFLGWKFMILRLVLTVVFVSVMGVSIERIIEWSDKKAGREVKHANF